MRRGLRFYHLFFFMSALLILPFSFIIIATAVQTRDWHTAQVKETAKMNQTCPDNGKAGLPFDYRNTNMYTAHKWIVYFRTENDNLSSLMLCSDDITTIQTITYNPKDPSDALPELTKQYLHYGMFVLIGIGFLVAGYLTKRFPMPPDRPTI